MSPIQIFRRCVAAGILCLCTGVSAEPRPDLPKHFAVSAVGGFLAHEISEQTELSRAERVAVSFIAMNALGIAKELSDEEFDHTDVVANMLGSALGIGASIAIDF